MTLEEAIFYRQREADAWVKAMNRADPDIERKVNAFFALGLHRDEMPVTLLKWHDRVLELAGIR